MASVSGGSIISSYYALGGEPATFAKQVGNGRFQLKRELTDAQNLIRLPFPFTVPFTGVKLFPWYEFGRD